MDNGSLILSQLSDPFRIGLLIGLVHTTARTVVVTGRIIPLLAGLVFVAVIIPSTLGSPGPLVQSVLIGLASNALILGVIVAAWQVVQRFRNR